MIEQNLSNTNEMCYSVQIAKICNLNKAQQSAEGDWPAGRLGVKHLHRMHADASSFY